MTINCINKANGCEELIRYEDMIKHESNCAYKITNTNYNSRKSTKRPPHDRSAHLNNNENIVIIEKIQNLLFY